MQAIELKEQTEKNETPKKTASTDLHPRFTLILFARCVYWATMYFCYFVFLLIIHVLYVLILTKGYFTGIHGIPLGMLLPD